MLQVLSAIFWGFLVLSLLVFVHEGGHYLAARAFGVRVTEFFLGLPCRFRLSFKSKRVGTEIGVTPLLLGGYNRICGMEPVEDDLVGEALVCVMHHGRVTAEEVAEELSIDPERAVGLLATLVDWGSIAAFYDAELGEHPNQKTWPRSFQTLARDAHGLTEYDRGHDFSLSGATKAGDTCDLGLSSEALLEQERSHTYLGCGFWKRFAMLAAGPAINVLLAFLIVVAVLMGRGVSYASNTSTIGSVVEDSIAEQTGLEAGDRITRVDDTDVFTWEDLVAALSESLDEGHDFTLKVERDGSELELQVDLPDGEKYDKIGIYSSVATYHPTFLEASSAAVNYGVQVAETAAKIIMPQHTMEVLSESSSIVGISVVASEAASSGFWDLAFVAAAISMSLGFMNLLPIPPLDGGKILIEVIQVVLRRKLSLRVQNAVSYVGLAFFLFVFVVVLKNDIVRYVIG